MDLHLSISPDHRQAVLNLPAGRHFPVEMLKQLIQRSGITQGLLREALVEAGRTEDHDREIILATGEDPAPAVPGEIDPPIVAGAKPRRVVKDECLGRWIAPVPAKPGIGVDGTEIPAPTDEPTSGIASLGHGIRHEESGEIFAARDGELTLTPERVLAVLMPGVPDRECSAIELQHDAHFKEAWIRLEPGEYLNPKDIALLLASKQVRFGIDRESCAAAMVGAPVLRTLVMARGTEPVPGIDARAEILIDDSIHLVEDADGRVDYTQMDCVKEITVGMELVRIHPATPGTDGMNFRGQVVKAKPGRDLDPAQFAGDGTRLRDSDRMVVEAAVDGVFKRTRSGGASVVAMFEVKGDLDMHTGAIETRHPVRISGDIKKGFKVKTEGDLAVGGSIEDARVSAQGNLTVKAGILPGMERVKAHGDVTARHINGRTVKCRNLKINGQISGSVIFATGEVTARAIMVSQVTAPVLVAADSLGDEGEQATIVQVGVDPYANAVLESARAGIADAQAAAAALRDRCKMYSHHVKQASLAGRDITEAAARLKAGLAEYEEACAKAATFEKILAEHEGAHPAADKLAAAARITVKGTVYPGVEIRIGDARLAIKTVMTRVTFVLKDGQISWF